MHAAGGNVLFYKDLACRLGEDQPCYGMQAVGLDGHQSAYDRIEDMAAHYIKEIRGVQPKGPYYVGGSSLGGLIAYEAGMQLRKLGEEVKLIALIDTWAPGYPIRLPGTSKISLKFFAFTDRIQHHIDTLRILEPGRRWGYVEAKAIKVKNQIRRKYLQIKRRIARGVLMSLGRPLPDALVATQNAIQAASTAYRPVPYQGDAVLFRASKRSRVLCHDDTLGWSNFVKGRLDIHEVNGSHGSIVVEPRVRFVAATLTGLLDNSENIGARSANNGID
jgi:thioesterase domain-containing protein